MSTTELTILYTFVDDFFQALFHSSLGEKLRHYWENKRGPKKKLSLSEVVTLNLLRFSMRVQDLKTFHRIAGTHYRRYFPRKAFAMLGFYCIKNLKSPISNAII